MPDVSGKLYSTLYSLVCLNKQNMFPVTFALFTAMSCFKKMSNIQFELHIL